MTDAIEPGATIGILGGGQLGRMGALAARAMGYKVHILDPDPACCASAVADHVTVAPFDDLSAAKGFAKGVDVITFEIEKIGRDVAQVLEAKGLRPGAEVLRVVQDKGVQKAWLVESGYPVGPYRLVRSASEATAAHLAMQGRVRLKVCQGGYDGRGQACLETAGEEADAAPKAFAALGGQPVVMEQELDLAMEFSMCVARRPGGSRALFPPAQNCHHEGQLKTSIIPAELPPEILAQGQGIVNSIADRFDLVGLLTVEFFVTSQHELFVNEMAPRPHNTFHGLDAACLTSQFTQHVRAVCNLPLGSTELLRPTALHNILGDVYLDADSLNWAACLQDPQVQLFLYGKQPRARRKVGHLLATGADNAKALRRVETAFAALSSSPP